MTLSVATYCSEANSKEFYLGELVSSVYDLADEIVIVDGDSGDDCQTMNLIAALKETFNNPQANLADKIWAYYNPWEWRLGYAMGRIQRSIAISHCTSDWVILLDADEVLHEKDFVKIKAAMKHGDEAGIDVFSFRTLHFYRDYHHIKSGPNPSDPGQVWYNHRPKMFRNNIGIFDMHDRNGNYSGLINRDKEDAQIISAPTSIEVFHYGHVRSKYNYTRKTNEIERSYHPAWEDVNHEEFEWDMSGCIEFDGTHPHSMQKRIRKFEGLFSKDGDV
jgi:glycosyltransferase involved in cell wall biosynthesis